MENDMDILLNTDRRLQLLVWSQIVFDKKKSIESCKEIKPRYNTAYKHKYKKKRNIAIVYMLKWLEIMTIYTT